MHTFIGQPVAWYLSNHESTEVIEAMLNSIKARSPLTIFNVMMTDDGTVYNYCFVHNTVIKINAGRQHKMVSCEDCVRGHQAFAMPMACGPVSPQPVT